MIIRLFVAILIIIAVSYAFNRFRRQPPAKRKKLGIKFALYVFAGIVLLLIATGRVHWITAIVAGAIPFIGRMLPLLIRILPFISQLQKQRLASRMSWGSTSRLESKYLKLELDQSSGRLRGEITAGLFAGKALSELSREQAKELLDFYQQDPESSRLLLAYLQQRYPGEFDSHSAPNSASQGMSRREALQVLGLEEGASEAEIVAAHKKLMQRLHPDRGGSNYLAAKVNEAKAYLLNKRA